MKTLFFVKLFLVFSFTYLLILFFERETFASFLKPMLLLPLFFGVFIHSHFASKKILLSALFFSWTGDVILLFSKKSPWFFIAGLVVFLVAHIFYIVLFMKERRKNSSPRLRLVIPGFLLIGLYLVLFLSFLMPYLGEMKLPVVVYALVISGMLAAALYRYQNWPSPAKKWIIAGAAFFVLSDSLLAINKFYEPFAQASFFIMFAYLAAQFGIVTGILNLHRSLPGNGG